MEPATFPRDSPTHWQSNKGRYNDEFFGRLHSPTRYRLPRHRHEDPLDV